MHYFRVAEAAVLTGDRLLQFAWAYYRGVHRHLLPASLASREAKDQQRPVLPPIYLQHQGHSRTIIGCVKVGGPRFVSTPVFSLVFRKTGS
jgi:hypothetical protein